MSHNAVSTAKAPAPWKAAFLEHVNDKMDSPEFVLSTLHSAPPGSPTPYVPRARYCIFRGMWAELPENKHNTAPRNSQVFESELPTFTTDIRMQKVPELFGSSHGHAEKLEQAQGSGGGGAVEAVWWVKEVMTQWRIAGQAYVIGPDIEGDGEESSGVRTVKSELGKRMHVIKEGEEGSWSWQKELTAHFGNLSPGMRGSFKMPPPGLPKGKPYDKECVPGEKLSDSELEEPVARKNFRVVVIKPDEVEQLDLSEPENAKRFKYSFKQETGKWETQETWP